MPAFGIGTPLFITIQTLVSLYIYSEAKEYGTRTPAVVGVFVLILGAEAVLAFDTVVGVVMTEVAIILIYIIGVKIGERRSASG